MPHLISTLSLGGAPDRRPDPSIAEAREALAFWRRREAELPWHRRAARAEARTMAMRSRHRLVSAQLERFGLARTSLLAPAVAALCLPRRQQARRLMSLMLATGIGRRLRMIAVTAALAMVAALAFAGVVAAQLL